MVDVDGVSSRGGVLRPRDSHFERVRAAGQDRGGVDQRLVRPSGSVVVDQCFRAAVDRVGANPEARSLGRVELELRTAEPEQVIGIADLALVIVALVALLILLVLPGSDERELVQVRTGDVVVVGGSPVTTEVAAESADPDPQVFVAVTVTRSVESTSLLWSR